MIGAGETAVAHSTLERLSTRVFPEMASQLIGTGEAPLTPLPGALVRLLPFSRQEKKNQKMQKLQQTDGTKLESFALINNVKHMEYVTLEIWW